MIDSAIRHCLSKVALIIELIEESDHTAALEELNELVVFLANQQIKKEAEG